MNLKEGKSLFQDYKISKRQNQASHPTVAFPYKIVLGKQRTFLGVTTTNERRITKILREKKINLRQSHFKSKRRQKLLLSSNGQMLLSFDSVGLSVL